MAVAVAITVGATRSSATIPSGFTSPNHVNTTYQGCRQDGTIVLPNGDGKFICDEAAYTSGNLSPWNELDLVPFQLITVSGTQSDATTAYDIIVAGDYQLGSATGWDVITAPSIRPSFTINNKTTSSDASCTVSANAQDVGPAITGGADNSIYRVFHITQAKGTTCIIDWAQRLALGAHLYSGSSLQAYVFETSDFSTGKSTIPLPVKQAAPQELDKDMTATQNQSNTWNVTKSRTPASVSIVNTCSPTAADRQAAVSVGIQWSIVSTDPSGPINIITHVYATNPAARAVDINVSDQIYSGTTAIGSPATAGPTTVPANSANVLILTHQTTVPSGTTNLNDIATATYIDTATQVAIPGSVTATASAPVQNGSTFNSSAVVNDVESITGSGWTFSADSFSPSSVGAFDNGYAGAATTGPVSWTSTTQTAGGSVTFSKTVYAALASSGSGALADTATLTGSDGASATASASINVSSARQASLTITKNIPNVLSGAETASFAFDVYDSGDNKIDSKTLTFAAGETQKSVTISGLAPDTYTVKEQAATHWKAQLDQDVDLTTACAGTATFTNQPDTANARAVKVTVPAGSESGWSMTLTGPGTGSGGETVATNASGVANFLTELQEGSYTIAETPQTGWDQTGTAGDCAFTVNYPADGGRTFTCTITNTKRGSITVKKVTDPTSATTKFAFAGALTGSIGNGEQIGPTSVAPGTYYTTETVPAGWSLTKIECSDSDSSGSTSTAKTTFKVAAGENVVCTYTNTQLGKVRVEKTVSGGPPNGQTFTFQLRSGASPTQVGTIVESQITSGTTGVASFTTYLTPGQTYQLCEIVMPGWSTTLGSFVPDSFVPPDGVVPNPNVDNSILCINFTVTAGQTKTFAVDNSPPPGGRALTIGFWKNWASCAGSNGKQKAVLDQTLAAAVGATTNPPGGLVVSADNLGSGWPNFAATYDLVLGANDCSKAVALLNKSTFGGKKMASDPLFNMVAQLVAAELNYFAGAGKNGATTTNIASAVLLDGKYNFNGTGYTGKLSAADTTKANCLAKQLDNYNNDRPVSAC